MMLGRKRVWIAAAAGAAAALGTFGHNTARAGTVAPGGNITLAATTSAGAGEAAGSVLRDERIPFTVRAGDGAALFEGTFQDRVVRLDTGEMLFAQTIRADRGFDRPAVLDFLRRTGFAGYDADADAAADAGVAGPEKVYRSADGDTLHFKFDDKLFPGDFTRLSFVSTDAAGFDVSGDTEVAFIGRGGVEGRVHLRTAQPSQGVGGRPVAIPLPPAAALFPLGAAAALWARRRLRRGA